MRFPTVALVLLASTALAGFQPMMPSPLGDARIGKLRQYAGAGRMEYGVQLPAGQHQGFTVVGWFRLMSAGTNLNQCVPYSFWCPDKIKYSNPDLLDGVGGLRAVGTNLSALGGSITIASFPFAPYTNLDVAPVSNQWPRGIYTISGWSSNAVVVTLGGSNVYFGPGEFTKNAKPGTSNSVIITGTGLVAVGISRTPCHRFFGEISSVGVGNGTFPNETLVTNGINLVVWRFAMEGSNQTYRTDIYRDNMERGASFTRTNPAPSAGCFDAGGDYRIGLIGVVVYPPFESDLFDHRVYPWRLSDAELTRIYNNGREEIQRRGIPQWR
jgi:hypothetical protein